MHALPSAYTASNVTYQSLVALPHEHRHDSICQLVAALRQVDKMESFTSCRHETDRYTIACRQRDTET